MADKEEVKEQQNPSKESKKEKKSLIGRLLPFLIIFIVSCIGAGTGITLSRIFAGTSDSPEAFDSNSAAPEETKHKESKETESKKEGSTEKSGGSWYYNLDPVIANLNEPSVTRYVSASLTFEMNADFKEEKGKVFLDEKKPVIINWITIYLSGLTIDNIRGDKNLMSIKTHIRESLNEMLFPGTKAQIKDVLIQKFPVQ
jgi:flagellar basal body-associated protein FliL